MSSRSIGIGGKLHRYLVEVGTREDDVLRRLREETAQATGDDATMQISPEQGQFMGWLVKAMDVRRALEVGTFTGYSSICMARALPAGGKMICIDASDEWTQIARRYWKEAGVESVAELRLGDGLDHLDRMIASGESGTFDLCFHDADKARAGEYVERFLRLLRPGGILLVDNALRDGDVAKPKKVAKDEGTAAIDAVNRMLRDDDRVDWCLLPVGDGLAMGRKR
jgi:caffeoyl-CoA O-methyltransferase